MNWINIYEIEDIEKIKEKSFEKAQVIFKHSTKCSISTMILNRLERSEPPNNADFYYLDLIKHRDISNAVSTIFGIVHESPQLLLIQAGKCIYNESHYGIEMDMIAEKI